MKVTTSNHSQLNVLLFDKCPFVTTILRCLFDVLASIKAWFFFSFFFFFPPPPYSSSSSFPSSSSFLLLILLLLFFLLLLPLALQPILCFGLSNTVPPFCPTCHHLSPSSHSQHLKISFYFSPSFPGLSPSSRPFQFLSEDLFLGILSSSILSRWPNHHINL